VLFLGEIEGWMDGVRLFSWDMYISVLLRSGSLDMPPEREQDRMG